MNPWSLLKRAMGLRREVPVRLRDTRPIQSQEECDELLERLWRARVQQNIRERQADRRRNALRVVEGGRQ